jgi:hypothetical protein
MKKIHFFIMVLIFLSGIGYAQPANPSGVVKVTLKADETLPDELGFIMLLDPTATAYGNVFPSSGWLSWYCELPSYVFDYFPYKIPTDAEPICNTLNLVAYNSVTIQIPAGIYDFVITYPFYQPQSPNGGSWGIPTQNGRADNYVFEEGYKYTFSITYVNYAVTVNTIIEEDIPEATIPGPVTNLMATPSPNGDMSAIISWTNPSVTGAGEPLSELTSIKIYENFGTTPIYTTVNSEIGSDESYTTTVSAPGSYVFVVVGENSEGEGVANSVTVNICHIVSSFPYYEEFENDAAKLPLCWEQEFVTETFSGGPVSWEVVSQYVGMPGHPHDGALKARFFSSHEDSKTKLITPRIDLTTIEHPVLKFWHTQRKWFEAQDVLRIYYKNASNSEWVLLAEYLSEVFDWAEQSLGLPNKSADYYIAFEGESQYGHGVQLDDISIINVEGIDGAALKLFGAVEPMVGEPFIFKAQIQNLGVPFSGYTVKLIDEQDNVLAINNTGVEMASMESKMLSLHYTPTVTGTMLLRAVLEITGDSNPDNNITPALSINVQPQSQIFISTIGTEQMMNNRLPFNFYFSLSRGQSIYFDHELVDKQGAITQLQYFNNFVDDFSLSSNNSKPLQIWMANTSVEKLNVWLPESAFTLVYDAPISLPPGENTCTIQLPNPFVYDGQNLVIMTNRPRHLIDCSNKNMFYITETPEFAIRSRDYYDSFDEFDWSQAGIASDYHPNIKMKIDFTGAKVTGTITSEETTPVEGATVELIGTNASHYLKRTTDTNGNYSFDFLLDGEYQFKVTKLGYYDVTSEPISVEIGNEYTVDITIAHLPTYTVSGKVTGNDAPDGIADVEIKLSGYTDYIATTDDAGNYSIPNIYATKIYNIEATKTGYVPYYSNVAVMDGNVIHHIAFNEIAWAVGKPLVDISSGNAVVTWLAPGTFAERSYILDDGSAEAGWRMNEGRGNLLGNLFKVGESGELTSIDVFGIEEPDNTNRPVCIHIYNEAKELIGTSGKFVIKGNEWTNVPLYNNVPFSETFYAMVKWHVETPGNSNSIGYDQNGPNSGDYANSDWILFDEENNPYFPQGSWEIFHHILNLYDEGGPFMIRANANIFGKSATYNRIEHKVQPVAFAQDFETLGISRTTKSVMAPECSKPESEGTTRAFEKYMVYRLTEEQPESEWVLLSDNVTETTYTDTHWEELPCGVYQYAVKAAYTANVVSIAKLTNKVANKMEFDYRININTNSGASVTGAIVRLTNQNGNPAHDYTKVSDATGVTISNVWIGSYNLKITLDGHKDYIAIVKVTEAGMSYPATLIEVINMPYGLEIDVNNEEKSALFAWNQYLPFFDDMESYSDFIIENIGNYTLHDFNGLPTFGVFGYGFQNQHMPHAFMVLNPSKTSPPMDHPMVAPYSRNKYLVSFAPMEGINDSWLILPKLRIVNGMKFSFWARSFSLEYPERMRVLVSTAGNNPLADFKILSESAYIDLPEEWTYYSYDLSAFSKKEIYLAINCISLDGFFMMLDDISVDVDESNTRVLTEYSVYLDGTEVDRTTATDYTFTDLSAGSHTAGVKTVYTSGESEMATIPFTIILTGIENNNETNIQLYPNPFKNEIYISHPELVKNVQITNVIGEIVKKEIFNGKSIVTKNLSNGVYFITIERFTGEKTVYRMVNN